MPSLLIRNVDTALHARLKEHAAAHHRSLEEDARELLRTAVAQQATVPQEHPVDIARRLFGPKHGVELDIPPRGAAPGRAPPDFSHRANKR
jgi:plasmid stability protein